MQAETVEPESNDFQLQASRETELDLSLAHDPSKGIKLCTLFHIRLSMVSSFWQLNPSTHEQQLQ